MLVLFQSWKNKWGFSLFIFICGYILVKNAAVVKISSNSTYFLLNKHLLSVDSEPSFQILQAVIEHDNTTHYSVLSLEVQQTT